MPAGESTPSFEEAFDDLAALAHRVSFRLLGSRGEAEDVTQETLVRAYVRWRRVSSHAEPWVARVATNLSLDLLRRRARHADAVDPDPVAATPDPAALDRLELARLLLGLPRRQREVVVLRYLADRSEAETAAQLGTSVGTVKQHAHRGLAALRVAWTDANPDLVRDLTDPGAL